MRPSSPDQRRLALAFASLVATLSGCAVAPTHQGGQSVTHDIANYFAREWPVLAPCDASAGAGCGTRQPQKLAPGCVPGQACGPQLPTAVWNRPTLPDPPPAVPLEPGPPGRFFPAPTQPVFTPQQPPPVPLEVNPQPTG